MGLSSFVSTVLLAAVLSLGQVETVTVTDTGFTVSCVTEHKTIVTLSYGESGSGLGRSVADDSATRFHYLSAEGLDPGVEYGFRLEDAEGDAYPARKSPPEKVRTLVPPPGRLLFSFAVMNDIHVGETVAGLITLPSKWLPPLTPGFSWDGPEPGYWDFTLRTAISQINAGDAELTVVNGDLTSGFTEGQFVLAKSYLDSLRMPYYVTRGNHDRVGRNPEDYFKKTFQLESSWYGIDHKGFHFVFLDDSRLADGLNGMPKVEVQWLEQDLAANREKPTFIFTHRPIAAGRANRMDGPLRKRLLGIFSDNPQIVGVFGGHSHRAAVATVPRYTGDVPYIEVPAGKEYPVGYGMVEVYEGGYMYNFTLSDCPQCREWNDITRQEYFGRAPKMNMRGLGDRNLSYSFSPEAAKLVSEIE